MAEWDEFLNKNIIVTGASSGIGRQTAVELSKTGAKLMLIGRKQDELEATEKLLEGTGHRSFVYDLQDSDGIEGLVNEINQFCGKIYGLVYCAGIDIRKPISMTTPEFLTQMLSVNFISFVEMTRIITKRKYREDTMSIVAISSVSAKAGGKAMTAYCASKAALDSSIRAMAHELADKKVRINSILPGFVHTNMYQNYADSVGEEAAASQLNGRQYLGFVNMTDITDMIQYLLSPNRTTVTGSQFNVDAGFLS